MKCLIQFTPQCEFCHRTLYQEFQDDNVLTLHCVNSECKEFNKRYTAAMVELVPYKEKVSGEITDKKKE